MTRSIDTLPLPLAALMYRREDEFDGGTRGENPDSLEAMGAEGIRLSRFALDMTGELPVDVQDILRDEIAAVRVQIERRGFLTDDYRRAANRLARALEAVEIRGAPSLGDKKMKLRYAVTALDGALDASEWIGDHLDVENAIGVARSRALDRRR